MPLPAAIPIGLAAAGLLGGSVVGQVLDRPRRFVTQDVPQLLGFEGFESGQDAARSLLGESEGETSPLALALGFGIDAVTDPLSYLGGGLGRIGGAKLGRVASAVDDMAARRAQAAMPLARDAAAGRQAADVAESALNAELSSARELRGRQLAELQGQMDATPRVVGGGLESLGEVPVPGGEGLLRRYAGAAQPPVPVGEMLSPELRDALAGTQGRRYKPREYSVGAAAGDLPMVLDAMGAGRAVGGGRVSLPVPASEMGPLAQARGGRLFPGGGLSGNPLTTLDVDAALTPNPEYNALAQQLNTLVDAPISPRPVSAIEALGIRPPQAVPLRFHTRAATGPDGRHLLDHPVADAVGPLKAHAAQADTALAEALAGPPPEAGPLGRLYWSMFGRQPRPDPGAMTTDNPVFALYKPR